MAEPAGPPRDRRLVAAAVGSRIDLTSASTAAPRQDHHGRYGWWHGRRWNPAGTADGDERAEQAAGFLLASSPAVHEHQGQATAAISHPAHVRHQPPDGTRRCAVAPRSYRSHLQGRLSDEGRPGANVPGLLRQDPAHGHASGDRSAGDHDSRSNRRQREGSRQRGGARRHARKARGCDLGRRVAGAIPTPCGRARAGRVHRTRAPCRCHPRGVSRSDRVPQAQVDGDRLRQHRAWRRLPRRRHEHVRRSDLPQLAIHVRGRRRSYRWHPWRASGCSSTATVLRECLPTSEMPPTWR